MFRLLFKLVDVAVVAEVHDAEAGGLFHGDLQDRNGAGGVMGQVLTQHVGVVHLVDVVAGENQDVLGVVGFDEGHVLVDGVGGSGEPGTLFPGAQIGRENVNAAVRDVEIPGLAGADVAVKLERAVLGQDTDGVDAGIGAVGERKVDDAILSTEGDAGFCHILGQSIEARTLPAGEKHRNTALLHMQPPFDLIFLLLKPHGLRLIYGNPVLPRLRRGNSRKSKRAAVNIQRFCC